MTAIPLIGGAYTNRSLIASAQRSVNLYCEVNPKDAPFPMTQYLTPGLTRLALPAVGVWRNLYRASDGQVFGVLGSTVYSIAADWTATVIGSISVGNPIVSMSDNGLVVVVVNGTTSGWAFDLATHQFETISAGDDASFYGADRVDYIDTYFVFNRPGTNQFYISGSLVSLDMLIGGPVVSGTLVGGAGYTNGTFAGVPLTGGTGTDATATMTVSGGAVTLVDLVNPGQSYQVGDVLSASFNGAIATGSITTGGTGYTDGAYTSVPLSGGSGTGAQATIVVTSGIVAGVSITAAGSGYAAADVLGVDSAQLGGTGSGFSYTVATVSGAGAGFTYTLTAVGSSAFDPLDIAAKSGSPDPLSSICVMHGEIWLIGELTTEVWYNSGAADFTFQRMPGVFIEHGCTAKFSVCPVDLSIFWLSRDRQGHLMVVQGTEYQAKRVSTHALENAIQKYAVTDDAIGFCYQQNGHIFYQLTFPTADKTWVYDLATSEWHERVCIDSDGVEHRHRANVSCFGHDQVLIGDFENGKLYAYDQDALTDDGDVRVWRRGFPHLASDGDRVFYRQFVAEMEVGTLPDLVDPDEPIVSLRWSDTRGASWGNPVTAGMGSTGQYIRQIQWQRLGMARDRVFELFGSVRMPIALMGAYVEARPGAT